MGPLGRYGAWYPGYQGVPYYEREVAVLIRDKKSGEPLYEARANSEGTSAGADHLLPAMFTAALQDFPTGGPSNPRRVRVDADHGDDDPVGAALASRRRLRTRPRRRGRAVPPRSP